MPKRKSEHDKGMEALAAALLLQDCGIDKGADFHKLRSEQVTALLREADRVRYRTPPHANGSRARCFHEHLQRRAKGHAGPDLPVLFRISCGKDRTITAVFPTLPADTQGQQLTVYEHVGQHSGATWDWYHSRTHVPANRTQYKDLLTELRGIYKEHTLRPMRRLTAEHREAYNAALRRETRCTYPRCKCIVQTSTDATRSDLPVGLAAVGEKT